MKKSLIFLSMCSAALLSSCGTSSYYASSAFEDGIYYRPDKETRQELEADRQEVQGLIEKTRQEAARFSDTIMLASINGTNSITSTAAATATPVNINVDNWYEYNLLGYDTYCSYWDWKSMVRPVGLSRGITACHPLRQTGHRHKPEDRHRPHWKQARSINRLSTQL